MSLIVKDKASRFYHFLVLSRCKENEEEETNLPLKNIYLKMLATFLVIQELAFATHSNQCVFMYFIVIPKVRIFITRTFINLENTWIKRDYILYNSTN